jgi:hypothetical protein
MEITGGKDEADAKRTALYGYRKRDEVKTHLKPKRHCQSLNVYCSSVKSW